MAAEAVCVCRLCMCTSFVFFQSQKIDPSGKPTISAHPGEC